MKKEVMRNGGNGMNYLVLAAHEAYIKEKQKKDELENRIKSIGEEILKTKNTGLTDKYFDLVREKGKTEQEINYWARRVADQLTDYINMDNQTLIR